MKEGIFYARRRHVRFFDFDYNNAVFEWDDNKADINFKKHGIRFETAVKIFADNNKLIWYDEDCPKMTEKNVTTVSSYEQCDCKNFSGKYRKGKIIETGLSFYPQSSSQSCPQWFRSIKKMYLKL